MSPKVSVVLPVWNGEKYLDLSLTSIVNQSFKDFEIIAVDDNSSDLTSSILLKYAALDSRIRVHRNQVNVKLPKSLNVGFSLARGKYLTWTSDDNVMHVNFLERLVNELDNSDADIVYSDFNLIDDKGIVFGKQVVGDPEELIFRNSVGASFLYKSDVQLKLNGYAEDKFMYEDYDFWFRSYVAGFTFMKVREVLYGYRQHPESLSSKVPMPAKYIHELYCNRNLDVRNFSLYRYNALINLINYPGQLGLIRWIFVLIQLCIVYPSEGGQDIYLRKLTLRCKSWVKSS